MKKIILVVSLFLILGTLFGCSKKKLTTPFNEETVTTAATDVFNAFNNNERYKFFELCTHSLKSTMNNKSLDELYYLLSDAGEFNEMKTKEMYSLDNSAIVVITGRFDKKKLTYSMTFTQDMKLSEFSVSE